MHPLISGMLCFKSLTELETSQYHNCTAFLVFYDGTGTKDEDKTGFYKAEHQGTITRWQQAYHHNKQFLEKFFRNPYHETLMFVPIVGDTPVFIEHVVFLEDRLKRTITSRLTNTLRKPKIISCQQLLDH